MHPVKLNNIKAMKTTNEGETLSDMAWMGSAAWAWGWKPLHDIRLNMILNTFTDYFVNYTNEHLSFECIKGSERDFLGSDAVCSVMSPTIQEKCWIYGQVLPVKLEAGISSESLLILYQTTRCHITDEHIISIRLRDNIKSHN